MSHRTSYAVAGSFARRNPRVCCTRETAWVPLLATLAALLLSAEMLVAIYSHLIRGKDVLSEILPAVVFFLLALVVLIIHWESFIGLLNHL